MRYGPELTEGARLDAGWTYRGLRAVVIENEVLRAVILADKGADIFSLTHKSTDTEFMWRSPWGVRDPSTYTGTSPDAVGAWMDHYEGGWQTVVPAGGYPSAHRGVSFGLHGEANLMPWDVAILDEGPERAAARFRVRLARTPLNVVKEVAIVRGVPTLTVREAITNESDEDIDLVWGHHIALGAPFLSDSCVIDFPGATVLNHAWEELSAQRLQSGASSRWPSAIGVDGTEVDLRHVPPPGAGFSDQVYLADLADGWYAVTNRERGVGLAVRFPSDVFRYVWYWQEFGGAKGYPWWGRTYNIGLEPFTSYPNMGLAEAVANGSAFRLSPRQTAEVEVGATAYTAHVGVEDVAPDGTVRLKTG